MRRARLIRTRPPPFLDRAPCPGYGPKCKVRLLNNSAARGPAATYLDAVDAARPHHSTTALRDTASGPLCRRVTWEDRKTCEGRAHAQQSRC
jgi:hypothetical protein